MIPEGLVYVIDDDASVRRALARLIAAAGFDVETFPSAEAFLHHPATNRPACLVLDVRLPGESGLELQAALGDARRFLPIIFVTGHGTVSGGVRAMKAGAVDFLQKPVDEHELLGGIQRALDRSREARASLAEQAELELRLAALTPREREVLRPRGHRNAQQADSRAARGGREDDQGPPGPRDAQDGGGLRGRARSDASQARPRDVQGIDGRPAVGPKANSGGSGGPGRVNYSMVSKEAAHLPIQRAPMVCVIDDDDSLLRALRRLLDATGFRVETFSSAEQFLESDHRGRADCLVLDVHLGGLSGLELQERLARSGVNTPVVIITAHDDASTRERARRAGAVEYLRKPFDDDSLIDAIHKAIGLT